MHGQHEANKDQRDNCLMKIEEQQCQPTPSLDHAASRQVKIDALNGIVRPPQAKIFINDVIKVQNQAIGMILHITI